MVVWRWGGGDRKKVLSAPVFGVRALAAPVARLRGVFGEIDGGPLAHSRRRWRPFSTFNRLARPSPAPPPQLQLRPPMPPPPPARRENAVHATDARPPFAPLPPHLRLPPRPAPCLIVSSPQPGPPPHGRREHRRRHHRCATTGQ